MNVIRPDNILVPSRGRGRSKARGKTGALNANTQSAINIVPKYQMPDVRKPLINFAPSSSSTITPKSSRRRYGTTSSSNKRSSGPGKTTDSGTGKTTTPGSIVNNPEVLVVVAVTCGRGEARGEVGLAAMDIQYPHMILCQIRDCNSYINTLTKIHAFNPTEIIMPDTMCESGNNLYNAINDKFENITITGVHRVHFTDIIGLDRIRNHCAKEFSSVELIVHQKYYALAAAAAVMKYIEFIQHIQYMPKSMRIEYQGSQNNTIIDIESAQKLELVIAQGGQSNHCLLGALDRCSTPMGRRLLRASILQPPCNQDFIEARLSCVAELVSNRPLFEIIQPVVRRLFGTSRLLGLAMYSSQSDTMHRAERNLNYILLLKNIIDIIPEFRVALNTAQAAFFQKIILDLEDDSFNKIKERISSIIHDDARSVVGFTSSNMQRCFAIKTGVSDMLDIARQTYCELIDDMKSMVNKLGDRYNLPLSLACNSAWGYHIEMNTGRRNFNIQDLPNEFINVKKHKSSILMTTEPLIVLSIHCDEASEELHVMSDILLKAALDAIREHIGCLFQLNDNVAELDLIITLAQVSSIPDYGKPTFGIDLELQNSKHPVMDIFGTESPTPNDVTASIAYNFHTITGPNMSGKTIYLKQIVLLQIMAQLGCYVPASKATFRIADRIFCKVGVRDDIEYNSSTFMLEMKEAQYILQSITPSSLVIIDELARSTTVEEGASIAWAICEELSNTSAFTFNATHFLQLLKLADLNPNVTNHYFEAILNNETNIDESRLVYTHQLKQGISSIELYGLTLARSTGLPNDILRKSQVLAVNLSNTLQPVISASNIKNNEKLLQKKKNYDTLVKMYQELQKKDTNSYKITELIKNLNVIEEDQVVVSTERQLSKNICSEQKSTQKDLPTHSTKKDEFKKPHPVDSPRSIKELLSPIQNSSNLGKRTSIAYSSLAPKPKQSKLEKSKNSKTPLSERNINVRDNKVFDSTPEEVKKILKNPLTDSNSPLFIGSYKSLKLNKKLSFESSTSISDNYKKKTCALFGAYDKQKKDVERSSSKESPLFLPQSGTTKLKGKLSRNSILSPKSYVSNQYLDMQNAIKTIKRINLSQESDADDDQSTASTSETFYDKPESIKLSKENDRLQSSSSIKIFAQPEIKSRMNIPLDNIPEQYSYMRHILKNVSTKITKDTSQLKKSKSTTDKINEYIVISDAVSRNVNISANIRDATTSIEGMTKSVSESSTILINSENHLYSAFTDTEFLNSQPPLFDFSISGPSNMTNYINSMNSISALESHPSIDTTLARITARQKEAEIFKIIEGKSFDEGNILGSIKDHISINSDSYNNNSLKNQ